MRWLAEKPPAPKSGDVRKRNVFAWKPARVGAMTVWLERFEVTERFFAPAGGNPGWWSETSRSAIDWWGY
jgi:hypothetical protein